VTIVINLTAFYTALYGWQQNKAFQESDSTGVHNAVEATGKVAANAVAAAAVEGETNPSKSAVAARKYHADRDQTQTMTIGGDDHEGLITENTRRRRLIARMSANRTVWGQLKVLPYRVNMWFVLSALLLSATTVLSLWMITMSLPAAYGTGSSSVPIVLFLILGTPAFLGASLMCFYFFPTLGVRLIGKLSNNILLFCIVKVF
jgi:hypothetical protein